MRRVRAYATVAPTFFREKEFHGEQKMFDESLHRNN
jgi:hypothetical protein